RRGSPTRSPRSRGLSRPKSTPSSGGTCASLRGSAVSTSPPRTSSCPSHSRTSTFMRRRPTTFCAGRVFGSGNATLWAGCARSRARRAPEAGPLLGASLPTEGYAVLHRSRRCALAQSHGLQRLTALDVIREGSPDLRDESLLILLIAQGS